MRWNVSDVSPSNERRRKGENKDRGLRIFLGSQLSARLGCTGWGYSHLSGCLCMSVSRQGSSTVCNHGNHKDVAPTIKRRWWHIIQMPHTRTRNHPPSIIAREEVTQPCVPERPPGKVTFCREESWELLLQPCRRSGSTGVVRVQRVAQGQLGLFTLRLFTFLAQTSSCRPPSSSLVVTSLLHQRLPPNAKPLRPTLAD